MWFYSDLIEINQRYYDVFSEETDRQDPDYWKSFIPHDVMLRVLDEFFKTLEGVGKKPLWIHGAYGTGKTHALHVLKHLLEDPWEDVSDYFDAHGPRLDLMKRLEALRTKGRGLVLYRSSTAAIDSSRRFMVELQVAIKEALAVHGLADGVPPSLYDQVFARLTAKDSVFDWQRAFDKYRSDFADFASAQAVIAALKASSAEQGRLRLLERVSQVLDAEGFYLMDDPAAIKAWLKEVISRNKLSWLVVMWDEFSDFFERVSGFSGLQELAQFSREVPFYFVLALHRTPDQVRQRRGLGQEFTKLVDRFTVFHYEMQEVTAYRMLSRAIRPKRGQEERWRRERELLWGVVKLGVRPFVTESDRLSDLQALMPLHPYAAYLLSHISRNFSSSQRTLFRFLRLGDRGSLASFLREHPKDDWRFYTSEGLWDYFFGDERFELPDGFQEVVTYFGSHAELLRSPDQLRAFKATMLLVGLSRATNAAPHMQPTLGNLRAIFAGTPLGERIEGVMDALCQTELVHAIHQGAERQYTTPLISVDRDAIKRMAAEYNFDAEVHEVGRQGSIGWAAQQVYGDVNDVLKRRLALTIVSAGELLSRRERVVANIKPYQLCVVAVVCRNEADRIQVADCLSRLDLARKSVLFVVAESPVTQERWDDWCEESALARWHREHGDTQNAQYHDSVAARRIADWLKLLRIGSLSVFEFGAQEQASPVRTASGQDGYLRALEESIARRFRYRPESVCPTATVHRNQFGAKGAEIGLGAPGTAAPYNVLVDYLARQGLWATSGESLSGNWRARPEHSLGQLQSLVDKVFAEQENVSLNELWQMLQAAPYGYYPSPTSVTLFGASLRDYVEGYYYRDGVNTRPLDRTKLASLIDGVMRDRQQATLTHSTPEAREFCAILSEVFSLPPDESKYPQNARDGLRALLTNAGYPLWSLSYVTETPLQSLHLLQVPLSNLTEGQMELSNERIAGIVPTLRAEREQLAAVMRSRPFEEGMRRFLNERLPSLVETADQLHLPTAKLMARLYELLQQEKWLWTEDSVAERLPGLNSDLTLVLALNTAIGRQDTELEASLTGLAIKLKEGNLPLYVLSHSTSDQVRGTLILLERLLQKENLSAEEKRVLAKHLQENPPEIRAVLRERAESLRTWITDNLREAVSIEESQQILRALPENSYELSEGELKGTILRCLADISKRQLVGEIRELWRSITGTTGPNDWSYRYGVPLTWMLEGPEYGDLLSLLAAPQKRSEGDLRAALALIEGQKAALETINKPGAADKVLLKNALGPYAELVRTPEDVEDLRKDLLNAFPRVDEWRQDEIQQSALDWLQLAYRARFYPSVNQSVEAMREPEAKALLKELANDPFVGMLVIAKQRAK